MGPALGLLAAAAVLAGWVFTNPVGGSPDELNHVLRAEAVGRGDLSGRANPELAALDPAAMPAKACCDTDNPARLRWVQRGARLVDVPPALDFGACFDLPPGSIGSCVDGGRRGPGVGEKLTTMGTLEPGPYVLPGLATRLAGDPLGAVRWARAANALVTLVLLGLAVWVLRSPPGGGGEGGGGGGGLAWVGLVVAVSPMVLFVGASPAPSALEVAGSLCFAAALVRLARAPDQPAGRSVWVVLAVGGAALAGSRSLGPVWVVLDVLAVAALAGWRRLWMTIRGGRGWAWGALAVVAVVAASTVGWELTHQPGVPFDVGFFFHELGPSVEDLPRVQRELVGVFGPIDIPLPAAARAVWTVLLAGLFVAALVVGRRRQRAVLGSVLVGAAVVTFLVSSALLRQNGFQVQGRHVLAFFVLAPLLAGEVLRANRDRLPWARRSGVIVGVVAAIAVAVHGVGLWTNLTNYDGPAADRLDSARPWVWAAAAVLGGVVALATALTARRRRASRRPTPNW